MAGSQPGSATAVAAAAHAQQAYGGSYAEAEDGGMAVAHPQHHGAAGVADYAGPEGGGEYLAVQGDTQWQYGVDAEGGAAGGNMEGGYTEGAEGDGTGIVADAEDGGAAVEAGDGTGAEGTAYSPAEYLAQLDAYLGGLQQQRWDLQQQLAAAAAASYQGVSQRLGTTSTGVPLPSEPVVLLEELAVLQAVRLYLQYVQELQALVRLVEKASRSLQQQLQQQQHGGSTAPPSAPFSLSQDFTQAVDSFSSAVGYAVAVRQLEDQGKVPAERLQQYTAGLLGRVDAAQHSLRAVLSTAIQACLAAAHWPPPLAVSGDAAAAAGEERAWRGFAAGPGGEAAAAELQQLLVVLTTLQRASQHEQFSALGEVSQEGPLLWMAEELAAPLAQRLRRHFASGLPTDRPDRPEWLFATGLKAAQQCSPLVEELQPCVEAHSLQTWYSLPLELARAVETVGVNAILSDHLLPKLVEAGEPSLWLHLADEAMQFGRRFAPLRGVGIGLAGEQEDFLTAAHPGSSIELLFKRPEWQDAWLGAEAWDATRQLEAACEAYAAWHPAAEQLLAVAGQEEDMVPDTPRARGGGAAWRREFSQPVCAEQVASLVEGLIRRGGWVHSQQHKLQYMQAVPLAVLRAYRGRLTALLQQAEQFCGMLGESWLPRVGAAVNAAHYIEHQLREPQGVLLLVELQDSAAAAAAAAAAASEAEGHGDGAAAAGTAPGSSAGSLTALMEREAAAYATLRKQWAYKLAKQAVDRFTKLLVPYKRDTAAFTAGYEEGMSPEAAEAAAAAAGPAAPSPAMLQAADSLQQLLRALAQQLDAVVFRDVWRSVALAVNYGVYNEVATEALFSAQGAAQLDADLAAMAALFGEYTSRPAAHLKESKEACRLLTMPHAAAVELLAALGAQPAAAKQLLAPHGVKALNAEQAAVVLLQRLDVLTIKSRGHAAVAAPAARGAVRASASVV